MQDVRDKIALVQPSFPRDVKDPLVSRADSRTSSRWSSSRCCRRRWACASSPAHRPDVVKGLENAPGVARIDVSGA